jgi:hypothetical protein
MISDLDETIKQLLTKKGGIDPSIVDISFGLPDREWSASLSKPTVNIYLYDIRENHQLRGTEWFAEKKNNGLITRKKNPSRIDLSYLLTIWTNDIADEHRLIWQVLSTLFRYSTIPEDVIQGQLTGQEYPIQTTTAQPDGLFNNPSDFWTALDNEIKPSINYVITLSLDLDISFTAPEVKTTIFDVKPPGAASERMIQIRGMLSQSGDRSKTVARATIIAREAGMTAETDDSGNYAFLRIPEGKHTFHVVIGGKKVKEIPVTVPGASYDLEV